MSDRQLDDQCRDGYNRLESLGSLTYSRDRGFLLEIFLVSTKLIQLEDGTLVEVEVPNDQARQISERLLAKI